MNLLTDIQYFPSVIFYRISYNFRHIVFEQYETYQKMSFRNRCQVMGSQGMVELSIPLAGGRGQKTLIKDVRIDTGQNWQAQHWKAIVTCYNRSPWFGFYRDERGALYRRPADFLMGWDLGCLEWRMGVLGFPRTIGLTEGNKGSYAWEDWVVDWRSGLTPRNGGALGASPYHQVFG